MPQADFYLLASTDENSRELFMCRLCERALKAGTSLAIYTRDQAHAEQLDPLLWQYQPASFLPHKLAHDEALSAPITLFWQGMTTPKHTALLNMADELPVKAKTYSRLFEIVIQQEEKKEQARKRYKELKADGWTLNMHDMKR